MICFEDKPNDTFISHSVFLWKWVLFHTKFVYALGCENDSTKWTSKGQNTHSWRPGIPLCWLGLGKKILRKQVLKTINQVCLLLSFFVSFREVNQKNKFWTEEGISKARESLGKSERLSGSRSMLAENLKHVVWNFPRYSTKTLHGGCRGGRERESTKSCSSSSKMERILKTGCW